MRPQHTIRISHDCMGPSGKIPLWFIVHVTIRAASFVFSDGEGVRNAIRIRFLQYIVVRNGGPLLSGQNLLGYVVRLVFVCSEENKKGF